MNYNDYLGPETISREYKEFTFNNCGLELDHKIAEDLIISSEWVFNKFVLKNLKRYIKLYIPKYSSAFLDKYSETLTGELYIGVGDTGMVNGIPFQGSLNFDKINKKIKRCFEKKVKSECKIDFNKHIKIELIKVDYKDRKINKFCNDYVNYVNQLRIRTYKRYKSKNIYNKWIELHSRYVQKLIDLFNQPSTRYELMTYIQMKEPKSPIIKLLKSDYKLEQATLEEINILKDDINSPYYWLCRWKDNMINFIRSIKLSVIELHEDKEINGYKPDNIIYKASPMIPWWMQNNKDMNLYVIKITFTKPQDNIPVYYLDILDKERRCYRTTRVVFSYNSKSLKTYMTPCCTPI
jgi:hypothetical protein